jgi:hypothetical protein
MVGGYRFFQIGGQGGGREKKTKWSPGLGSSQNGQNGLIHQTDAMVGAGSHQPLLPCPRKNPCNTLCQLESLEDGYIEIRESNNLQRSLQRVQAATILQWAAVATLSTADGFRS